MGYTNAFEAVDLPKDEATIEALRADLAAVLRDWIKQHRLTQAAAGHRLGIPQSVVSNIVNGNTSRTSIEYLIRLLARVDVAWTARCWRAPSDAAAVKGPAPQNWMATGLAATPRAALIDQAKVAAAFWLGVQQSWNIVTMSNTSDQRTAAVSLVGGSRG